MKSPIFSGCWKPQTVLYSPSMKPTVILFDVDGVLVQPAGYRAAVQATVNYFCTQMGLEDLAPDVDTIAIFEAQGITCEWDMVPLLLAMVFDTAGRQIGQPYTWSSVEAAIEDIRRRGLAAPQMDYPPAIRALGRYVRVGEAPADSILAASRIEQDGGPFPRLAGQGVLSQLLSHTRRPQQSLTTQVFTTFSLGDSVYASAMRMPALFQCQSALEVYDRPLLDTKTAQQINALQRSGRLHVAAYTARPSIPDHAEDALLAVFAPEAEMALRQVGLSGAVIVGSGQMGAAALQLGENEDRLIKPAPYHALAAAAAALAGERTAALEWAKAVFRWVEQGGRTPERKTGSGDLPASLTLHIFEDSPSGIRGGKAAAELLSRLGVEVDLYLWGVTAHPDKTAALKQAGAVVYADINQALTASGVLVG
jgi:hypothetical protein